MSKTFIYCVLCLNIYIGSCAGNYSSTKESISQAKDSFARSDSLKKYYDYAWLQNRSINAELIGRNSRINLALTATFSQKELLTIYKQKAGTITVFCYFNGAGKVTEAYIDYCKSSNLIKRKFNLLLRNFEKYLRIRVDKYYIKQMEKGESFYTAFLIKNLRLFSVDEIANIDKEVKLKFREFNDTARNCQ